MGCFGTFVSIHYLAVSCRGKEEMSDVWFMHLYLSGTCSLFFSLFWLKCRYSYDQSLVHTVMLSSEHNMTIGSSQYVWLENDLAKVNRSITPWLVVEMHRPMYSELDRFLLCVFDAQTLFFLHSNKNHPTVSLHPNRQRTGKLAKSHGL